MSLKPGAPDAAIPNDRERYRLAMVAYYATPEIFGWVGSDGPKPVPEKSSDGRECYREHGALKYLDDGLPVVPVTPVAPVMQPAKVEAPKRK